MNAQKRWKIAYHCWKEEKVKFSNYYESDKWASQMVFIRREAALERKLAAAQRTIEAQAQRIEQLENDVDDFELERDQREAFEALVEFTHEDFG